MSNNAPEKQHLCGQRAIAPVVPLSLKQYEMQHRQTPEFYLLPFVFVLIFPNFAYIYYVIKYCNLLGCNIK